MSRRLFLAVLVSMIVVVLICISAYAFAKPTAEASWGTQTEEARAATATLLAETRSVQENNAAQTQTAEAVLTAQTATQAQSELLTAQARPSDTPIPSPTIQPSDCKATLKGSSPVYLVPASGWDSSLSLDRNTQVQVTGKLDDGGWYPIKTNDLIGWVPASVLSIEDPNCPAPDSLSHLLSMINGQSFVKRGQHVIVEDTFQTNLYRWKDELGTDLVRNLDEQEKGNYRLLVNAASKKKSITSEKLPYISNPIVAMSLFRVNNRSDSYISIVFDSSSNPGSGFEIRILGDACKIQVFENGAKTTDQVVDGTDNACSSPQNENYLEFSVNGSQLLARVNGQGPYPITLSQDYGLGRLSLAVDGANVRIGFLVITTQ